MAERGVVWITNGKPSSWIADPKAENDDENL
jgi:hypothetical protein